MCHAFLSSFTVFRRRHSKGLDTQKKNVAFFCMLFFEVLPFTTLAVSVNSKISKKSIWCVYALKRAWCVKTPLNYNRMNLRARLFWYVFLLVTPSRRLRAGARHCGVSRRNVIKVPVRFICSSGVKDDSV